MARESTAGANTLVAGDRTIGGNLGFDLETTGTPQLSIASGGRSIPSDPQLTPREIMALETYTGSGSPEINRALREGRGVDFQHDIADLRSALRKLPNHPRIVYWHMNLPEEVLAQHQIGAVVTELGFMSTSTRPYANKRNSNVHIAMASFSGKSIKQWSRNPDEEEFLFLDGTSYREHYLVDRNEQGRLHRYISAVQIGMPTAREYWIEHGLLD